MKCRILSCQHISIVALLSFALSALAEDLSDLWKAGFDELETQALQWKPISATAGQSFREWPSVGTVLGFPVVKARCTTSEDKLIKMFIQLLDLPPGASDATFAERFKHLRNELPATLSKQLRTTGIPGALEPGAVQGSETLLWELPEMTLTAIFEPGRRVWLTLSRTSPERLQEMAAKDAKIRLRINVTKNQVGDIILKDLPSVEVSNSGSLGLAQWLCRYFGWQIEDSRIRSLVEKHQKSYLRDLLSDLGREAGQRAITQSGFDFDLVREQISRGYPVIFLRSIYQHRVTEQISNTARVLADPTVQLPTDADEQRKWPRTNLKLNVWLTAIVGFNSRRKEIIFSQPGFDGKYQNLRMRVEEAEMSSIEFTWFDD